MRLVALGLLLFAFILLLRSFFFSSSPNKEKPAIAEMVKDPNCETYVPKDEAVHKTIRGVTHYFCSKTCAEEFSKKS